MFWKKTLKLYSKRLDYIFEQQKSMAKQLNKLSEALEKTVYPGMNETREAIVQDRTIINKIIAKVWHKKGTK